VSAGAAVVWSGDPVLLWASQGGGTTSESVVLHIAFDGAKPDRREIERLAYAYLADGNGYTGNITGIHEDRVLSAAERYSDLPALVVAVSVDKEW
jgi:hypothetical protein